MTTFADLLTDQLRREPGRPLVTFYDDMTAERVELSVATFGNWVAKTASLLQEELGLERGDRVRVDLPTHWLTPVWLAATWSVGLEVTDGQDAALVVCGPDGVEEHARSGVPVIALSLLPMGARFAEPLPEGVVDYGAVVWGQPDSFATYDPPEGGDPAWRGRSHTDLLDASAATATGTRLLTDGNPVEEPDTLVGPLAAGGGTIWVRHPDPAGWEHRAEIERATETRRAQPIRS